VSRPGNLSIKSGDGATPLVGTKEHVSKTKTRFVS
jgi:hypothetical protein